MSEEETFALEFLGDDDVLTVLEFGMYGEIRTIYPLGNVYADSAEHPLPRDRVMINEVIGEDGSGSIQSLTCRTIGEIELTPSLTIDAILSELPELYQTVLEWRVDQRD